MSFLELFLVAIGVAMDAFAVAICKGLAQPKVTLKGLAAVGLWFGGFQALMPLLGWLLGTRFDVYITSFDHWIAFALLVLIGANMIREAFGKEDEAEDDGALDWKTMLVLAVATSIDALAVGVSFAFLDVRILPAVLLIGVITCLTSCLGLKIGNVFGARYKQRAELAGGIILVLIGIKILLEHLGLLPF